MKQVVKRLNPAQTAFDKKKAKQEKANKYNSRPKNKTQENMRRARKMAKQ